MKKLTIGRDEDCDIVIIDHKGLVSRKHALLNISALGNYEIIDVSKNGTFVNGMRIKPHVPHTVRRKDVVVFANSAKLDWSEIRDNSKIIRIICYCLGVLIAGILCFWLISSLTCRQEGTEDISQPMPPVMNSGSVDTQTDEESQTLIEPESTPVPAVETQKLPKKTQAAPAKENISNKERNNDQKKRENSNSDTSADDNSAKISSKATESQPEEELKAPGGD